MALLLLFPGTDLHAWAMVKNGAHEREPPQYDGVPLVETKAKTIEDCYKHYEQYGQ